MEFRDVRLAVDHMHAPMAVGAESNSIFWGVFPIPAHPDDVVCFQVGHALPVIEGGRLFAQLTNTVGATLR